MDENTNQSPYLEYENWLILSGKQDNEQSMNDYFDYVRVIDIESQAIDSPLDNPFDDRVTEIPDVQPVIDGIENAKNVIDTIKLAVQADINVQTAPLGIVLADTTAAITTDLQNQLLPVAEIVNETQTAIEQNIADEISNTLTTLAPVLSEFEFDTPEELSPPYFEDTQNPDLLSGVLPSSSVQNISVSVAPPGIDQISWDNQSVTCDQWQEAVEQYVRGNWGLWLQSPIGEVVDTPFGPISYHITQDDSANKQTFPFFGDLGFVPGDYQLSDPSQIGRSAYPQLPYPDWMDTTSCGGTEAKNKQEISVCLGRSQFILEEHGKAESELTEEQKKHYFRVYNEYLKDCVAKGGKTPSGGGTGNSCDNPIYVKLCEKDSDGLMSVPSSEVFVAAEAVDKEGGVDLPPGCDKWLPFVVGVKPGDPKGLSKSLGLRDKEGNGRSVLGGVAGGDIAGVFLTTLLNGAADGVDTLQKLLTDFLNTQSCVNPQYITSQITRVLLGFVQEWTHGSLQQLTNPLDYASNEQCPTLIPTIPEAMSTYYGDQIDTTTLKCWVEMNGGRWDAHQLAMYAGRNKYNVGESITALRRGIIQRGEYDRCIRQLGYLEDVSSQSFLDMTIQIPPISDLIRFMVRDVADQELVNKFGMDSQFSEKWTGKVEEFAEMQGIHPQYAQLAWRAHWSIPSPTQLYEMYHRLRFLPANNPARMTFEDLKTALIQQDILPYWIDKYVAISFKPLTRVDTRRMFDMGVMDYQGIKTAYLDQGYDDNNAKRMADFAVKQKQLAAIRNPLTKKLTAGIMTLPEFTARMEIQGFQGGDIAQAANIAYNEMRINRRKTCMAAYKKRYFLGDFDDVELRAKIVGEGIEPDRADELVATYNCEKSARGTVPVWRVLLQMFNERAIDSSEFMRRLVNLHYTTDDAYKMVTTAQRMRDEKDESKLMSLYNREKSALKEQRALLKQSRAGDDKELLKLERRRAKLNGLKAATEKVQAARNNVLLTAAKDLSNKFGVPIGDTFSLVKQAYDTLSSTFVNDLDTIARSLAVTSQTVDDYSFDNIIQGASKLMSELTLPSDVDIPQNLEASGSVSGETQPSESLTPLE